METELLDNKEKEKTIYKLIIDEPKTKEEQEEEEVVMDITLDEIDKVYINEQTAAYTTQIPRSSESIPLDEAEVIEADSTEAQFSTEAVDKSTIVEVTTESNGGCSDPIAEFLTTTEVSNSPAEQFLTESTELNDIFSESYRHTSTHPSEVFTNSATDSATELAEEAWTASADLNGVTYKSTGSSLDETTTPTSESDLYTYTTTQSSTESAESTYKSTESLAETKTQTTESDLYRHTSTQSSIKSAEINDATYKSTESVDETTTIESLISTSTQSSTVFTNSATVKDESRACNTSDCFRESTDLPTEYTSAEFSETESFHETTTELASTEAQQSFTTKNLVSSAGSSTNYQSELTTESYQTESFNETTITTFSSTESYVDSITKHESSTEMLSSKDFVHSMTETTESIQEITNIAETTEPLLPELMADFQPGPPTEAFSHGSSVSFDESMRDAFTILTESLPESTTPLLASMFTFSPTAVPFESTKFTNDFTDTEKETKDDVETKNNITTIPHNETMEKALNDERKEVLKPLIVVESVALEEEESQLTEGNPITTKSTRIIFPEDKVRSSNRIIFPDSSRTLNRGTQLPIIFGAENPRWTGKNPRTILKENFSRDDLKTLPALPNIRLCKKIKYCPFIRQSRRNVYPAKLMPELGK